MEPRKFKDGDCVRLRSDAKLDGEYDDDACFAVQRARAQGKALFVRNDGTSVPEIVDAAGARIGYARESALELAEHPALTLAKAEVVRLSEVPAPNLTPSMRQRCQAFKEVLEAFGMEYRLKPAERVFVEIAQ